MLARIIISVLQGIEVLGLAYHYSLLAAAIPVPITKRKTPEKILKLAFAIPAHNEAMVLPATLTNLFQQNYPRNAWDVYVVADHCDDETAVIARSYGAVCFERNDGECGRKAFAVRWLIQRIVEIPISYDGIVILDADSQPEPDFLWSMAAALADGQSVIQGQHRIINARNDSFSGLADVDMRINNVLRNRAKHNLGLSARLMGDAMCFSTKVLRTYGWGSNSLAEDREYGLFLVIKGLRIFYAPDAISWGQSVAEWQHATPQRLRWYGGQYQIRRHYAFKLLRLAFTQGNLTALDMAVELLLPSFSTLAALSTVLLGLKILNNDWGWLSIDVSLIVVIFWAAFPVLGLWIDEAPPEAFNTLVYGPIYLLWRLGIDLLANIKRGHIEWIRTRRNEEKP
jgi:cellulose synthase/poly-beta-1,6-N-acetylglucosamine synthase-like glycosyltransferase